MKLDSFKRLADKIKVVSGDCWLWQGKIQAGYGITRYTGMTRVAHRVIYELLVGQVQPKLVLDHLCRNRGCVNPTHLEPVTQSENTIRGDHWNRRKIVCSRGHAFIPANVYSYKDGSRSCIECRRINDRKRCPRSKYRLNK